MGAALETRRAAWRGVRIPAKREMRRGPIEGPRGKPVTDDILAIHATKHTSAGQTAAQELGKQGINKAHAGQTAAQELGKQGLNKAHAGQTADQELGKQGLGTRGPGGRVIRRGGGGSRARVAESAQGAAEVVRGG